MKKNDPNPIKSPHLNPPLFKKRLLPPLFPQMFIPSLASSMKKANTVRAPMVVTVEMIIPAQPNMEVKPVSFNPQPYLVNFRSSSSSSKVSFFLFRDIFSDRDG